MYCIFNGFVNYRVKTTFVCFQLLELLIQHKLCSLSGTAQKQLLNLVEEALNSGEKIYPGNTKGLVNFHGNGVDIFFKGVHIFCNSQIRGA